MAKNDISELKKDDYLWESMFSVAQPTNRELNFLDLTPEEFLEYYVKTQTKNGKMKFVEIVAQQPERALKIAQEVVKKRKTTAPVEQTTLFSEKKKKEVMVVYVDAGTKNNGRVGEQETRIAASDENEHILFDMEVGDRTINEGEILAIIYALQFSRLTQIPLRIYSDSRIAVGWAKTGKTNGAPLREHFAKEANLLLEETESEVIWVPREKNKAGWFIEKNYTL